MKFTGEERRSVLLGAPLFGAGCVELLGLLQAVALGIDLDDLGSVDEAVDESDHAGGVWEDLAPFGECLIGAQEQWSVRVVAG